MRAEGTPPVRDAAAVLLTRGRGADVEAFVVLRSPALRFFGGYRALPGGVVDAADADGAVDDDAFVRCAWRELFEETGVLPPGVALPGGERARLREGLCDPTRAVERPAAVRFRSLLDAAPAARGAAVPFGTLTTPAFAPVRYRTRFVHVPLPDGEAPEVVPGELVEGAFVRPAELLRRWRRGEALVAPPVLYLLEHLAARGLEGFLAAMPARCAELEAGRLHPIRNVPGIVMAPLATRTIPPATTTNAYLVGEERLVVVDPAPDDAREQERLLDLVDGRVAAGARVVAVALTHHHGDHVGAAARTALRHGVPVLAHAETLARFDAGGAATRALDDGESIELGRAPDGSVGWRLTALHTPGHAPGHLAFVDSRYRAVLAGDLVSTVSTIVIDPPEGHLATYLASLRRLRDAGIGVLHPAHGPVARDGHAVCERFLAHRAAREAKLVAALERGVRGEDALLDAVYDDAPAEARRWAARSLAAGLEKLAEDGRPS